MPDQNGLVEISSASGEYDANRTALTGASQPEVSVSALVAAALAVSTSAQRIIIDVARRKVVAATHNHVPVSDESLLTIDNPAVTLRPVAGSVGRSVQWEETARDEGMQADTPEAIGSAIIPVRPYRSVQSLVSAAIAAIPQGTKAIIIIDQNQGTLRVADVTNDLTAAQARFDAAYNGVANADDGVAITLVEPPSEGGGGAAALKFEGGAFA